MAAVAQLRGARFRDVGDDGIEWEREDGIIIDKAMDDVAHALGFSFDNEYLAVLDKEGSAILRRLK